MWIRGKFYLIVTKLKTTQLKDRLSLFDEVRLCAMSGRYDAKCFNLKYSCLPITL